MGTHRTAHVHERVGRVAARPVAGRIRMARPRRRPDPGVDHGHPRREAPGYPRAAPTVCTWNVRRSRPRRRSLARVRRCRRRRRCGLLLLVGQGLDAADQPRRRVDGRSAFDGRASRRGDGRRLRQRGQRRPRRLRDDWRWHLPAVRRNVFVATGQLAGLVPATATDEAMLWFDANGDGERDVLHRLSDGGERGVGDHPVREQGAGEALDRFRSRRHRGNREAIGEVVRVGRATSSFTHWVGESENSHRSQGHPRLCGPGYGHRRQPRRGHLAGRVDAGGHRPRRRPHDRGRPPRRGGRGHSISRSPSTSWCG